jgi:hypothetical protein
MKKIFLFTISIFLIFPYITGLFTALPSAFGEQSNSPNIIIITWSGIRFQESVGDSQAQFIPYLKNDLFPKGTLYTNMRDTSFEFHIPPIAGITTGRRVPLYKYGMDRVLADYPTIFQYARKHFQDHAENYWEIGSYGPYTAFNKSDEFGPETRPAYILSSLFPQPRKTDLLLSPEAKKLLDADERFYFDETEQKWHRDMWDAIAEVNYRLFKKVMRVHKPRVVLFNITSADIAHGSSWAKYIAAIRRSDEITHEIWEFIQQSPYYKDNTYLFVTPDHERNRFFMQHTEDTYENSAHVWTYIYGPDIVQGQRVDRETDHIDICTTLAHILGIDATYSKGEVLTDAFLQQ